MIKKIFGVFAAVFILAAIPVTTYLISNQRDLRSRAAEVSPAEIVTTAEKTSDQVYDLNKDGKVNIQDLTLVSAKWGDHSKPKEDINQDGNVDSADLNLITSNWR